jgi:hypothetical protein
MNTSIKQSLNTMKKKLKKHFIPHEGNQYKPHFLREASVGVVTLIIIASFFVSVFHASILVSRTDFLAAVLPGVLVDLTNEERQDSGLGGLTPNSTLAFAAQLKANDMAAKGYFAHNTPEGLTPWHFFYQAGYVFTFAGENLAVKFSDSDDVVRAWMESPGHRENILNGNFSEIGIATAEGEYKGEKTIFVVQLFGRPPAAVATVQGASSPTPTVDPEPIVTEPVEVEEEFVVEEEPVVTEEEPDTIQVTSEGPISEDEEETDVAPQQTETIEITDVIESNDSLYIAVRDTSYDEVPSEDMATSSDTDTATSSDDEETPVAIGSTDGSVPNQSTFVERLLTSPQKVLKSVYMGIGALIVLALLLSIAIEVEKQHTPGIAYGLAMLAIIVGLTYLNQSILFSDVVIAGLNLSP